MERWTLFPVYSEIQGERFSLLLALARSIFVHKRPTHTPLLWSLWSEKNNQIYNSTVNIYSQINTMF